MQSLVVSKPSLEKKTVQEAKLQFIPVAFNELRYMNDFCWPNSPGYPILLVLSKKKESYFIKLRRQEILTLSSPFQYYMYIFDIVKKGRAFSVHSVKLLDRKWPIKITTSLRYVHVSRARTCALYVHARTFTCTRCARSYIQLRYEILRV